MPLEKVTKKISTHLITSYFDSSECCHVSEIFSTFQAVLSQHTFALTVQLSKSLSPFIPDGWNLSSSEFCVWLQGSYSGLWNSFLPS